jgi:serine/threonine protein kinase
MRKDKTKTRKKQKIGLHLALCAKKGGSRNELLTTFKSVCSPKEAHAKLLGTTSLKSPDEADEFVHVVKSLVESNPVIVKVQEYGRMLIMELAIQKRLATHPNVVHYVCDFECKFNPIIWTKPLEKPHTFCDAEGTKYHLIIMEYINHSLHSFLEGSSDITVPILTSLVKQMGFTLLDIHLNYGISHNDLNRGNILLHIDEPETITYTFEDICKSVDTFGHRVVLIDFQRSSLVDDVDDEYDYKIVQAADEISLAYELMKKWSTSPAYKSALHMLMMNIMNMRSLYEIIDAIDSFTIFTNKIIMN